MSYQYQTLTITSTSTAFVNSERMEIPQGYAVVIIPKITVAVAAKTLDYKLQGSIDGIDFVDHCVLVPATIASNESLVAAGADIRRVDAGTTGVRATSGREFLNNYKFFRIAQRSSDSSTLTAEYQIFSNANLR